MFDHKPAFLRSKKGFNDVYIIAVISSILLFTSIIIPFINDAFQTSGSEFNTDGTVSQIIDDSENVSSFNAFNVLLTLMKLAIWDFGDSLGLPFWLDAFFTLLSIVLIITLARNIWIGGGG